MVDSLTAKEILAIPDNRPERLFTNDLEIAKHEFRVLSFKWFPDRNNDPVASDVFIHIKKLYELAKQRIGTSQWEVNNTLVLTLKDGSLFKRHSHVKHDFELGYFSINDTSITFVVKPEYKDFYQNGISVIKSLPLDDAKIKSQIQPLIPSIETQFEAKEGLVLILKKTKDVLLLRDVLNHLGKISDKHTAWIFGRLVNLCCYLQFIAKVTHNAINPDTVYISPLHHSAHLFGGWWFATPSAKSEMIGVPKYTMLYGYPSILRTKKPDYKNDLSLIKAVARELLGDVNGLNYLKKDSTYPKPLVKWLGELTTGNAIKDYEDWEKVRDLSFGPRKFVVMPVTAQDLYS